MKMKARAAPTQKEKEEKWRKSRDEKLFKWGLNKAHNLATLFLFIHFSSFFSCPNEEVKKWSHLNLLMGCGMYIYKRTVKILRLLIITPRTAYQNFLKSILQLYWCDFLFYLFCLSFFFCTFYCEWMGINSWESDWSKKFVPLSMIFEFRKRTFSLSLEQNHI